jgi:hypothetical protein
MVGGSPFSGAADGSPDPAPGGSGDEPPPVELPSFGVPASLSAPSPSPSASLSDPSPLAFGFVDAALCDAFFPEEMSVSVRGSESIFTGTVTGWP